uniref:Uncharacterized protein n=1 Tax=Lotharella oceanica TaxID=641309 RepID=A0A7S2TF87_9EUKA
MILLSPVEVSQRGYMRMHWALLLQGFNLLRYSGLLLLVLVPDAGAVLLAVRLGTEAVLAKADVQQLLVANLGGVIGDLDHLRVVPQRVVRWVLLGPARVADTCAQDSWHAFR